MVCGCTQKGAGMHELKIVRERREGYGSLTRFRSSADVYAAFKERFEQVDREEFLVLVLDAKNAVLGFNLVSVGTLTSSLVHPREVFKPAILESVQDVLESREEVMIQRKRPW